MAKTVKVENDKELSVVLIPVGGPMEKMPADDSLEALQALVGGFIQVVPWVMPDGQRMLVDEDARLKASRPGVNLLASEMAGEEIRGPAVLLRNSKNW